MKKFPPDAFERLTPKEQRVFHDDKSILSFINRASLDRKLLLAAQANKMFICLWVDLDKEIPDLKDWYKLYNQYEKHSDKRAAMINKLTETNLYAVTSREILSAGYLIAQSIHSPYFMVNLDFKKVANAVEYTFENLDARNKELDALKEADHFRKIVAKFFMSTYQADNFIKTKLKLDMISIQILMFLFVNRDVMVDRKTLINRFPEYSKVEIGHKITSMKTYNYIHQEGVAYPSRKYTISELGVIAVNEVLHMVSRQATEY